MREVLKRLLAVMLILTLVISTISVDLTTVKAADYSTYFTFASYAEDVVEDTEKYSEIKEIMGKYEVVIDGNSYINYGLNSSEGGSATAICEGKNADGIINGNAGSGYQGSSRDVQSMVVDLHRTRSISVIQLSWETASAQTYGIDFSLDGVNWTTVAYIEDCTKAGKRVDQINLVTPQNTRYVRMQGIKRQTAWAYNLYEISIYSASGRADGSDPISVYTYTEEQQEAIDNAEEIARQEAESESISRAESESISKAEAESLNNMILKYEKGNAIITKGTALYRSSTYNGEGSVEALTDGDLTSKSTIDSIKEEKPNGYYVLDLGREYTADEIEKVFIHYQSNSGCWGKEGFKIYGATAIDITTVQETEGDEIKADGEIVIGQDNTEWSLLMAEENSENCQNQTYFRDFTTTYEGTFRYIKLEYNYISKEVPYGIQICEFGLFAPAADLPTEESTSPEPTTEEPTTEEPTTEAPKRPVTEAATIDVNSTVTDFEYRFKYKDAGFAAGSMSVVSTTEEEYDLYWGTGNDINGYKALTRNDVPYTKLGSVTTTGLEGTFTVISDYTAIPSGATHMLVYDEEHNVQYAYEIPAWKLFDSGELSYTFAAVGDQHYNRYYDSGSDDALIAFDKALSFIDSQGITLMGGIGDLSNMGEKSAFIKYKEALNDYPNIFGITCVGNHDTPNNGAEYFKQYVNQEIYKYIDNEDVWEEKGILAVGDNDMDFVYSPKGTDDVFIILNQNIDSNNSYTQAKDLLYDNQLDWLDEQCALHKDSNIFLFFHTYLSTDNLSVTQCVGNLINAGGYFYNLTYDTSAKDGERLRSIINKYSNVTMFSGHSHWMYSMQMFNKNLNIGSTSGIPFNGKATMVHVSSVTEPRYIGMSDVDRTGMNNKASEGTFCDVYADANVFTGVDFWNSQYEAYATYIDPKVAPTELVYPTELSESQLNVTCEEDEKIKVTFKETAVQSAKKQKYNILIDGIIEESNVDAGTYEFPHEIGTATVTVIAVIGELESIGVTKTVEVKAHPVDAAGLVVTSNNLNEIVVTFSNPEGKNGASQLYNIYIGDTEVEIAVMAGSYTFNNQNAGINTVKVVATLCGYVSEGVTEDIDVEGIELSEDNSDVTVTLSEEEVSYTGEAHEPIVTVFNGEYELKKDIDYTVEYSNNVGAGIATATVKGKGIYEGILTKEFTIKEVEITDETVVIEDIADVQYVGGATVPIINIKFNDVDLVKDVDYTIICSNNEKPGVATVKIEGIGNFTGSTEKTYNVVKKEMLGVTINTSFDANKKLVVTASNGEVTMTEGVDYTVIVETDAKGNITITLTGMGENYTGTVTKVISAKDNPNAPKPTTEAPTTTKSTTEVSTTTKSTAMETTTAKVKKPARVKIKKVKKLGLKKAKVTWKKLKGVKGYQIRYSTSKKMKKAKKKLVKKNKSKYTIKKLKKKKYFIQVRAYKVVNGKKHYGKWSKKKKVNMNK